MYDKELVVDILEQIIEAIENYKKIVLCISC